MQGVFGITADKASASGVSSVIEQKSCDTSDANDWFSNACKHLLPTKAGTALHYSTGFEERSCQRYAAGHATPTIHFLRALLRSPQGWTWLCVAMDGADADWWREVKYAYEIIAVMEAKRKELLSGGGNELRSPATRGASGAPLPDR